METDSESEAKGKLEVEIGLRSSEIRTWGTWALWHLTNNRKSALRNLNIRAIFDTVAKRVLNTLNLGTINTAKQNIATFGYEKAELQAINLVELVSLKQAGSRLWIDIEFIFIPCYLQWFTGPILDLGIRELPSPTRHWDCRLKLPSDCILNFFDGNTTKGEKWFQGGPVARVLSCRVKNLLMEILPCIQKCWFKKQWRHGIGNF